MKKYAIYFFCALVGMAVFVGCTSSKKSTKKDNNKKATEANVKKEEAKDVIEDNKAEAYAEEILKDMSLDEKIGQMLMVNLDSLSGGNKEKKKPITKVSEEISEAMKKYPVGGIVLNAQNMVDKEQTMELVQELQDSVNYYPLYIATTEEWGKDSVFAGNDKLGGVSYPMLSEISMTKTMDEIYEMGKSTGEALKELGINFNLAPVADVSDGIKNAQYEKYCFSSNEDEVSEYITNAVKGMRLGGVCTALTNFPGMGAVVGDYKESLINNDTGLTHLRDVDWVPFSKGIEAGTDAVKVSHVSLNKITQSDIPASMSELVMNGILRDELSFDGMIITDSMNAPVITEKYEAGQAELQAIQAGADIVLEPANVSRTFAALREAVANRSIDEKVLNEAVLRILKNKIQRGIITIDGAIND